MNVTGKVSTRIKQFVRDRIRQHSWNLGVADYRVDILYMDANDGDFAQINIDRKYLRATLYIYPSALKSFYADGGKHLSSVLAHEIAHIATEELYEQALNRHPSPGAIETARERVTERVGRLSERLVNETKGK